MHIALVSFEYSGTSSGGGIGTYVRNAAAMLGARGHAVEVFTSAQTRGAVEPAPGVQVHYISSDRNKFAAAAAAAFSERHFHLPFDVIEGPEYGADAAEIACANPTVPLVVKLHTPASMISDVNNQYITWMAKARFLAGGLRRGRLRRPYWWRDPDVVDPEMSHTRTAHIVTGPSQAILDRFASDWNLSSDGVALVPNVFTASAALLNIDPNSQTRRITYFGKLEVRKGVLDLATAIPLICASTPNVTFRLIGRSLPMPASQTDVKGEMLKRLGPCRDAVEFIDAVPYDDVPSFLATTDICVFPSIWENFPYACLEAMAAARGVIGSSAGGMAEIIEDGRTGLLVPPRCPQAIANAVSELLADSERRIAIGREARSKVITAYSRDTIGPMQEAAYDRAIERARKRFPRAKSAWSPGRSATFSIFVCTRNRAKLLQRCLAALLLSASDLEIPIVVVDNGSTDETANVVAAFHPRVTYSFEAEIGLSHARNRALALCTTDYIVFLDDDGLPDPSWVPAVAAVTSAGEADIFGGPYTPFYTETKPAWFDDDFGSAHIDLQEGMQVRRVFLSGGNMGWRTAVLQSAGGFDPDLGIRGDKLRLGEETALQAELYRKSPAPKVYFARAMSMKHHVSAEKMRLSYIFRRSLIFGWQLVDINPHDPLHERTSADLLLDMKYGFPLLARVVLRNRTMYPSWRSYAARFLALNSILFGLLLRRTLPGAALGTNSTAPDVLHRQVGVGKH